MKLNSPKKQSNTPSVAIFFSFFATVSGEPIRIEIVRQEPIGIEQMQRDIGGAEFLALDVALRVLLLEAL